MSAQAGLLTVTALPGWDTLTVAVIACAAAKPALLGLLHLAQKIADVALFALAALLTLPEYLVSSTHRAPHDRPPRLAYAYSDLVAWSITCLGRITGLILRASASAIRAIPALLVTISTAITALVWSVVLSGP